MSPYLSQQNKIYNLASHTDPLMDLKSFLYSSSVWLILQREFIMKIMMINNNNNNNYQN